MRLRKHQAVYFFVDDISFPNIHYFFNNFKNLSKKFKKSNLSIKIYILPYDEKILC